MSQGLVLELLKCVWLNMEDIFILHRQNNYGGTDILSAHDSEQGAKLAFVKEIRAIEGGDLSPEKKEEMVRRTKIYVVPVTKGLKELE